MKDFKLPAKWVVKVTPSSQQVLSEWKRSKGFSDPASEYEYIEECGGGCFYEPHDLEKSDKTLITFEQFRKYVLNENITIQKIKTAMHLENNKIISKAGTTISTIAKEVFLTRTIKVKTVKFDKKDKTQEKPIVTYIDRDVSVSVIADKDWNIYAGYSIRNPKWDKENKPELAKTVARNRAVNDRTNLTKGESITPELVSKHVLKGVADLIFSKIGSGIIEIKGVK